jgi:hypothetical protein
MEAPEDYIPVYIKQGAIIPWRNPNRRSIKLMQYDPLTLIITVSGDFPSRGTFFQDDGETFGYETGDYIYRDIKFDHGVLSWTKSMIASKDIVSGKGLGNETSSFSRDMDMLQISEIMIVGIMKIPELHGMRVTKGRKSSIGKYCLTDGDQTGGWRLRCPPGVLTAATDWELSFSKDSEADKHQDL